MTTDSELLLAAVLASMLSAPSVRPEGAPVAHPDVDENAAQSLARDSGTAGSERPRLGHSSRLRGTSHTRQRELVLSEIRAVRVNARSMALGEPLRDSRRLHFVRRWSHGKRHTVFPRGRGAGGAIGAEARGRPRIPVGGDPVGGGQDRMFRRDAAEMGPTVCWCGATGLRIQSGS